MAPSRTGIPLDPAFRDWVFWWYLATIELTDQLIERQSTREAVTP